MVPGTAAGAVPEPTDEDLKRFYDNHQAKFTQPEFRKIGVLAVTPESVKDKVQITEDDLKAAFEKDKDKLGTPETPARAADLVPRQGRRRRGLSEDPVGHRFRRARQGAGLQRGRHRPRHAEARRRWPMPPSAMPPSSSRRTRSASPSPASSARPCCCASPRSSRARSSTFEEAKPELEKKVLKDRAQSAIFDLHDRIEDERASGTQLSEVADKFKLNYQVFDQVDRRGQAPDGTVLDLPQKTDLLNAVFATEVGVENDPLDAKDEGLIWYEVLGITPKQLKPLDQVKDEVKKDWSLDEQRTRLAKYTDELVKQLELGQDARRPRQGAEHAGPDDASR